MFSLNFVLADQVVVDESVASNPSPSEFGQHVSMKLEELMWKHCCDKPVNN
jgi:hypothetical protein